MAANRSGLQTRIMVNNLIVWDHTLPFCIFPGATLFPASLDVTLHLFGVNQGVLRVSRGHPKIPREQRDGSNWGRGEARGGRIPAAVSDRRATKPSAPIGRHPLGPGFFEPGAVSLARHIAPWLCSSLDSLLQAQNPSGAATGNFRTASNTIGLRQMVLISRGRIGRGRV